jgi:hypothetical protein
MARQLVSIENRNKTGEAKISARVFGEPVCHWLLPSLHRVGFWSSVLKFGRTAARSTWKTNDQS